MRPLRRSDKAVSRETAHRFLNESEYAYISTVNADNTPYSIPVLYAMIGENLYFHCAGEGQKKENLEARPKVCVSALRHVRVRPEKRSVEFESVVAEGTASFVGDETEKRAAMRAICDKYAKEGLDALYAHADKHLAVTCICRIHIDDVCGKARLFDV